MARGNGEEHDRPKTATINKGAAQAPPSLQRPSGFEDPWCPCLRVQGGWGKQGFTDPWCQRECEGGNKTAPRHAQDLL